MALYGYALKNGTVVDDAQSLPRKAALYTKEGIIAVIVENDSRPAQSAMDVCGKVVAQQGKVLACNCKTTEKQVR